MTIASNLADVAPRRDSRAAAAAFDLEHFTDLGQVESLWRDFEADAVMTTYQRFDFLDAWMAHVGRREDVSPFVVVGSLDGKPAFLWPFGLTSQGPWRIARWLGGKHANYNLGLYAADVMDRLDGETLQALLEKAANLAGRIDAFELFNQPESWMGHKNPFLQLPHQPAPSFAYSLTLEEDFENVVKGQRRSKARKKLRWQDRKLAEVGGYKCVTIDDPVEAHRVLTVFAEQKAKRFAELGMKNAFGEPGVLDFFHELIERSVSNNVPVLKMAYLEVDGKIRSTYGGGICRGRYSAYFNSIAMDDLTKYSPGELLLSHVIKYCCDSKLDWFDLGVGEAQYKRAWCDTTDPMFDAFVPITSSGHVLVSLQGLRQRVKRSIKQNPVTWAMVQKLRKARAQKADSAESGD